MKMEIVKHREHLPSTVESLRDFIMLEREKVRAYRLKVEACERIGESKLLRDEALKDGQEIAAQVLYAEAKLGGILAETVLSSRHDSKLPEDISRDMSSQCQTLHRNPEAIEVAIASAKEGERIPTKGEVLKAIKADAVKRRLEKIKDVDTEPPEGQYEVIVIDPPWPMEKIEREVRPNQVGFDYPTMSEEELSEMSIPCAEDCHVWVWTTHKFLPMALRLLDAWSLKYVCTFVWHKPGGFQPQNLPQYNCEFSIYARRGSPEFSDLKNFNVCFDAPRHGHSVKPGEFYSMVRRVTTGRRLDMFSRREIDGFSSWGLEAHG